MDVIANLRKEQTYITDWKAWVEQNFGRRSETYTYAVITNIEVHYKDETFHLPTKIVFEGGYVKYQKDIERKEKTEIRDEPVTIIEKSKIIPFSFYERKGLYTGEIYQILNDLLDSKVSNGGYISPELLSIRENPLFSIDSNLKWPSYLLMLEKQHKTKLDSGYSINNNLSDVLQDYGIHYNHTPSIENNIFVIFQMPYLKIIENKIRKTDRGELIFLVLEYNKSSLFFHSKKLKLEIEAIIKNTREEVIHQKSQFFEFSNTTHQVVELIPEQADEIGFAQVNIKINNVKVDSFSGYYIREIKFDIKVK